MTLLGRSYGLFLFHEADINYFNIYIDIIDLAVYYINTKERVVIGCTR